MAEGLPVFESGQPPLARDFQALVAAVRGLFAGGVPVFRVGKGGRVYQPFVCAGETVLRRDGDGVVVARAAELFFEAGEVVFAAGEVDVERVNEERAVAKEAGAALGVHARLSFGVSAEGVLYGAALRSVAAMSWCDLGTSNGGGVLLGGEEAAARGGRQVRWQPWVMPVAPLLVRKRQCASFDSVEELLGSAVVLPAPAGSEQAMAVQEGANGEAVRWCGRLDKAGILHLGVNKE